MRAIQKQGMGGYHLTQAQQNPPQTKEQASSAWGNFKHKAEVLERLLAEQYYLCCYSELGPQLIDLGWHIEHVENKSQQPQRTFDYSNLAASAFHSDQLGQYRREDVFGGHALSKTGRKQAVDMGLFISPQRADCARFFAYLSDGRVVPALTLNADETKQAEYTIQTLNLNSPLLLPLRRRWWEELEALSAQHLEDDWCLEQLAAVDLSPVAGKLKSFFSLTRQFFGPRAEQALQANAPTLL